MKEQEINHKFISCFVMFDFMVFNLKFFFRLPAPLMLTAFALTSCMKIDGNSQPDAAISLVNAYSAGTAVDIYIDRKQRNEAPVAYSENLPYTEVKSGYRTLTVTKSGSTDLLLPEGEAGLSAGNYYTFFLAKDTSRTGDIIASAIISKDSLYTPAEGRARLRFVNLTYNAPALDLTIKGDTIPLFKNQAFKAVTLFKSVNPDRETFKLSETGKEEPAIEFQVDMQPGKIYTVFTTGSWGNANFEPKVMVNK